MKVKMTEEQRMMVYASSFHRGLAGAYTAITSGHRFTKTGRNYLEEAKAAFPEICDSMGGPLKRELNHVLNQLELKLSDMEAAEDDSK